MKWPVFLFVCACSLFAAEKPTRGGGVAGVVIDPGTNRPMEYATITLRDKTTGATLRSAATDAKGAFAIEDVPTGDYELVYGTLGADDAQTVPVSIDAQRGAINLGRLGLGAGPVKMERVEVRAAQSTFLNSIDRKVYNVGKDIQSVTGTASDLLQNLPSVQVDIDGNVSLRGSSNVLILVDGRTSALMGRTRAEMLQQLSANDLQRIEVITNPSAKYKPDGTAGIINLVFKRKREPGHGGVVNLNVGDQERANAIVSGNYNPGRYNLTGSYSLRQDDRERRSTETRSVLAAGGGVVSTLERSGVERSRPLSHAVRGGVDITPDDHNKLGATANYVRRTMVKRGLEHIVTRDDRGGTMADSERARFLPEFEEKSEFALQFDHRFAQEEHELKLELRRALSQESEDSYYTQVFRVPVREQLLERTAIFPRERETELSADYTRPLTRNAKLEAGYTLTSEWLDADFLIENGDPGSGTRQRDATRSNRFQHERKIHAFYATYGRTWEKLGLQAGVRPEWAETTSRLVTTGATIPRDYGRVYPSVHLAYRLTGEHELQLNYSHRVHRPDADELNPFPEYTDPFNLHAGNPRLLPEDIHSVEAGYALKGDQVNLTSSIYHRYLYHGFTSVTRDLGNAVLLTTHENLAESRSTGVELTASKEFGKRGSLNFSSNTFFQTIDASNLGFSARKSNVSWTAKLGGSFQATKETLVQLNTGYVSSRLTAQGSRRPTAVVNLGARHSFLQKRAALVITVSDLFDTLRESTRLDTPALRQSIVRRREARITYVGLTYNFGKASKKKDDGLKFDTTL